MRNEGETPGPGADGQERCDCISRLMDEQLMGKHWRKNTRAGIFKQSMGARNRGGIWLSYRPARLHSLLEFIPWNRFLGSINVKKYGLR
jgi:hypothetical protein